MPIYHRLKFMSIVHIMSHGFTGPIILLVLEISEYGSIN